MSVRSKYPVAILCCLKLRTLPSMHLLLYIPVMKTNLCGLHGVGREAPVGSLWISKIGRVPPLQPLWTEICATPLRRPLVLILMLTMKLRDKEHYGVYGVLPLAPRPEDGRCEKIRCMPKFGPRSMNWSADLEIWHSWRLFNTGADIRRLPLDKSVPMFNPGQNVADMRLGKPLAL